MSAKLSGKTALITGASAGIGWASALALAEEGANIVLSARRQERLSKLEAAVQKAVGKAVSIGLLLFPWGSAQINCSFNTAQDP